MLMKPKQDLNCNDVLAPIEKLLRFSGIWPVKHFTIKYSIKTVISWVLAYTFLGLMFTEVIHVMGDIRKINEVACTLTPVCVYCFKMASLLYYKKNFFKILDTLNSDLFNTCGESVPALQEVMKVTNKGKQIFQILTLCVIIFYTVFPILDQKELPIPFSFNLGRYRYGMHFFQITALSLCAFNLTSIDLLFVNLAGIAAAIIDALRWKLANVVSEAHKLGNKFDVTDATAITLNRNVINMLRECVMLHIEILRYIDNIETIFSFSLLIHYLTAIVLICSSLLQLTTVVDIHSTQFALSCMFVLIVLVQSFLYSWFGNEVIVKSSKISEACYVSDWYGCNVEARKVLLMLMMGAQRPLGVTIYKFALVSLASFLTIVRWSYSFAALIRTRYMSK